MQYSFDGTKWNPLSFNNFEKYASGDTEVDVYLRILADKNYSTSKTKLYKLPKFSVMPTNLKLDYYTETITGASPNVKYQYTTNPNTSSWKYLTVSNLSIQIKQLIGSYDTEIYIREIKDGSTPSMPVKFTIPKRNICPSDIAFVYTDVNNFGKATLKNVNSDIEYKINTSTKWETAKEGMTFELPSANTSYIFRIKANEGSFLSTERPIIMYTNANYSAAAYSNGTEEIYQLTKKLEWKIENNNYQPYTLDTPKMNMSSVIDAIPSGKSVNVYVRIMTTEKLPNSKDKIITLYSRLLVPNTVSFDKNTKSLVGVNRQMQYRKVGETGWKSVRNNSVDLSSLIGNSSDVKIEVKVISTSGNSESKIKTIECY